jgi:hypothetical protein
MLSSPSAAATEETPTAIVVHHDRQKSPARASTREGPKRSWQQVPNANGSLSEIEPRMIVLKVDEVTINLIIIYDPMGQPDEVVNEINAALGSSDNAVKIMTINILTENYIPIAVMSQGKFIYRRRPYVIDNIIIPLGGANYSIEFYQFFRGFEVFGRRNEIKMNFIPANSIRVYENFTDDPHAINFDVESGSWIDYRPQYTTVPNHVTTPIQFFRECDGKEVNFEPRDHGRQRSYQSFSPGGIPSFNDGSVPTTPVGSPTPQAPRTIRKKVKVIEKHIVLTKDQVERFLGFSEVLNKLRTDYGKSKNTNSSVPTTPGGIN